MANRWETIEALTHFIFLGSQITADGDGKQRNSKMLAPWKESYNKVDSELKSRNITVSTSQNYSFFRSHIWMWQLDHKEGWVMQNWCFELWCWRRLLRVPWTARRSYQSVLQEINPEYSLKGLKLKLKLQPPDAKSQLIRKDPDAERLRAGEEGDNWEWDGWVASKTQWTWVWAHSRRWWRTGKPACCSPWGHRELDMTKPLNNGNNSCSV